MYLTAYEAGEYISKFIDKGWPHDRESVYEILDLVNTEIWQTGLFTGSTKWFYSRILSDNTIVTPHGYSKLLGLKIGCEAVDIKDQFWMFHENGPFDEPSESTSYTNIVQHLGDFPTLFNHYKDSKEKCCKSGFSIAVVSCNSPAYTEYPRTVISGLDKKGKPIYSYPSNTEARIATDDEIEMYEKMKKEGDFLHVESDILQGVQLPITSNFTSTPKSVLFSDIINIAKDPTMARVDYYAIPEGEKQGILIASLEPFQTMASYSIYKVKNNCIARSSNCCLGLFKISPPEKIVSDNQFMIIPNKMILLDFAKYVHKKYYKEDFANASVFLNSGINALAAQMRNENPTKKRTLQIDSMRKTSSLQSNGRRKSAW